MRIVFMGTPDFAAAALSALLDLPTGAVTVWTMAAISIAAGTIIGHRAAAS